MGAGGRGGEGVRGKGKKGGGRGIVRATQEDSICIK